MCVVFTLTCPFYPASSVLVQPSVRPDSSFYKNTNYVAIDCEREEDQEQKRISNSWVKQVKCQRTGYATRTRTQQHKQDQKTRTKRQAQNKNDPEMKRYAKGARGPLTIWEKGSLGW